MGTSGSSASGWREPTAIGHSATPRDSSLPTSCERHERPRTLAAEEHQALVGVIELASGRNVFAVSVTLPFAEAEQCQANGPALHFFLVAIGDPAEIAIGPPNRDSVTPTQVSQPPKLTRGALAAPWLQPTDDDQNVMCGRKLSMLTPRESGQMQSAAERGRR